MFNAANPSERRMLSLDFSRPAHQVIQPTEGETPEDQTSIPAELDPSVVATSTLHWPGLWTGGND